MRASVLWIVVTISLFASLGTVASLGQEKPSELTVEEIVSRHEATWAKLKRLQFDLETQNRLTVGGTSTRIALGGKIYSQLDPYTSESHVKGTSYLDGDRVSSSFQNLSTVGIAIEVDGTEFRKERPDQAKRPISKEIIDKDLLVSINSDRASVGFVAKKHPRAIDFLLGRGISMHLMAPTKTLREWFTEAQPSLAQKLNDSGEQCWVLAGKFQTQANAAPSELDRTDDLVVTLNAARGYLVESIVFTSVKQDHLLAPKTTSWAVTKWQDLADGQSFPAQVEWNLTYWNLPTNNWLKGTISNVLVNPDKLEEQFKVEFTEGSVVFDTTGRPAVAPVRIWGSNGKPTKTYASQDDYYRELRAKNMAKNAKRQEEHVAAMFPGCTVKVTRIEEKDDFHTVVYDEHGAVLQEFKSNQELAIFEGTREMIRIALGGGEQETRRR